MQTLTSVVVRMPDGSIRHPQCRTANPANATPSSYGAATYPESEAAIRSCSTPDDRRRERVVHLGDEQREDVGREHPPLRARALAQPVEGLGFDVHGSILPGVR